MKDGETLERWSNEERTAYVQAEIAAGRHSTAFKTVCDGCRKWVSEIWTIVPGSHKRLCYACCNPQAGAKA